MKLVAVMLSGVLLAVCATAARDTVAAETRADPRSEIRSRGAAALGGNAAPAAETPAAETPPALRGRIGIEFGEVTSEVAGTLRLPRPAGAHVRRVVTGSPAERAGLKVDDVILRFADKPIERSIDLPGVVQSVAIGTATNVQIWRAGAAHDLAITVGNETLEEEILLLAQQQLSAGNRAGAFQSYVRAYGELASRQGKDNAFEGIALIYPTLTPKPGLPEDARRFLVQARVHVEEKNLAGAIKLYDQAIALAPWWPSSHFDRALLYGQAAAGPWPKQRARYYADALAAMKRFLALAPGAENAREGQDKIYEWELKLGRERQLAAAAAAQEQARAASATLKQPGQSGCFIATAAFGSALEPQVMVLRRFRDTYLLTNDPGRWFVKQYYTYSPPLADFIRERDGLRASVRAALWPIVTVVAYPWWSLVALLLIIATTAFGWRHRTRARVPA